MKRIALVAVFCAFLSARVLAQNAATNAAPTNSATLTPPVTVSATQASNHMNAEAVVTGTIAEVHQGGSVVHLNFEKPYPDAPFTAVIFGDKIKLFADLDKLKGKTVEVTGKITEYRKKPEIVLNSTNQLKVIEKVAAPAAENK